MYAQCQSEIFKEYKIHSVNHRRNFGATTIKTRILQVDEETLNDEDYVIDHEDLILSAVSLNVWISQRI